MNKLSLLWGKWWGLSAFGKATFVSASILLLLVKIGLTFLPFDWFRKLYSRLSKPSANNRINNEQVEEMMYCINSAANHIPIQLLCLPRALVAKYMLRNVSDIVLEIGVQITSEKVFEAHAWVERNGEIIMGEWPDTASYKRIWSWE